MRAVGTDRHHFFHEATKLLPCSSCETSSPRLHLSITVSWQHRHGSGQPALPWYTVEHDLWPSPCLNIRYIWLQVVDATTALASDNNGQPNSIQPLTALVRGSLPHHAVLVAPPAACNPRICHVGGAESELVAACLRWKVYSMEDLVLGASACLGYRVGRRVLGCTTILEWRNVQCASR
jgi:hypothetical protein